MLCSKLFDATRFYFLFLLKGKIVVQKPLDREVVPNYTLRVTATDNGNPPRYGETSVSQSRHQAKRITIFYKIIRHANQ